MADLRDEYGHPIQLSDEHGNPVQLKDEYSNPMQLTGVAITHTDFTTVDSASPGGFVGGGGGCLGDTNVMSGPGTGVVSGQGLHLPGEGITYTNQPEHGFGSSSSSSSEDDGQGGRTWKKKGLKQKIKEKLTGGKTKDELEQTVGDGTVSTTATHHDQHEKKTMMEKIKEKLPGHHNQY